MEVDLFNKLNLILQTLIWLVMVVTIAVNIVQLKEIQKSSSSNNLLSIVNFLQQENIRDARATVRKKLRDKPVEKWTEEERRDAPTVCASYDVVSFLLFEEKFVNHKAILDNWGPSILDCYGILSKYIKEMQKEENSGPNYWDNFGVLAEAASMNLPAKPALGSDRVTGSI